MARRIGLTTEQRGELVLRLLRKEATAGELAREVPASEATVYQWRDAFLKAGLAGLNGGGERDRERRHARELAERDQVIGEMTVAMRVLKKKTGECRGDRGAA